jgi:hypothetical protein
MFFKKITIFQFVQSSQVIDKFARLNLNTKLTGTLFACMYLPIQKSELKMKFFQKIVKESLAPKSLSALVGDVENKGINTVSAIEYSAVMTLINCKNAFFNGYQFMAVLFSTVEKITQVSKVLQRIKSVWILAVQIISFNSNLVLIRNVA